MSNEELVKEFKHIFKTIIVSIITCTIWFFVLKEYNTHVILNAITAMQNNVIDVIISETDNINKP